MSDNDRSVPEFTVETAAIADLTEHPRNYRRHPEDQVIHIEQSIREHGLYRNVVVARDGVPILIDDVARVVEGHEIRRGAVTAQGRGEAVLGLGFMLIGENSRELTRRLEQRLAEVAPSLPPEAEIETVYSRTDLVDQVLRTVRNNLLEGALLVIAQNDRRMRIEVGRGLEGTLTDSISGRIIRDVIAPEFRAGRFAPGIVAGVRAWF